MFVIHVYYILLLYERTRYYPIADFFSLSFQRNAIALERSFFLYMWECVCVALSSSTIRFLFKIRIEHTQFFGAFDLDETLLLIKANTCSMEHLSVSPFLSRFEFANTKEELCT